MARNTKYRVPKNNDDNEPEAIYLPWATYADIGHELKQRSGVPFAFVYSEGKNWRVCHKAYPHDELELARVLINYAESMISDIVSRQSKSGG